MAVQQALTPAFEKFFNFERDAATETPPFRDSPFPDPQDVDMSNIDPMLKGGLDSFSNLPQQPDTLPLESSSPNNALSQISLNWLYYKSNPLYNNAVPPYKLEAQSDPWPFDSDDQILMSPRPKKQAVENLVPLRISKSKLRSKESKQRNTVMSNSSKHDQRPKRKTRRKQKNTDLNSPAEFEKRTKFLERNRVAAAKCRQKRKEWITDLNDRVRKLQQNKALSSQLVHFLKEEVLFLKGELLKHSSCGCPHIKAYLQNLIKDVPRKNSICPPRQHETKESPLEPDSSPLSGVNRTEEIESRTSPAETASTAPTSLTPATSSSSPLPESRKLEALLKSELTPDTSTEGIAKKLEQNSEKHDVAQENPLAQQ